MKTAGEIYTKDHPNVVIDVVETPSSDIQTLLQTYLASDSLDELPDIFLMDDQVFSKYLQNYPELFADLTDSGINFADFAPSKAANSVANGKNYGVPYDSNTVVGTINGSWICATIMSTDQEEQKGNWAVTNMPKLNDYPGATNYSAQGGSTWAVSSSCKNYDLAVDFFKTTWAGSTEFYDSILTGLGAIATYLPAAGSDAYNETSEYFSNEAIYSKIVSYGSNIPTINKGIYWSEEKEALGVAITNVLNGTSDLDAAIEEAQSTVEFITAQ